ncbi:MAG TPA: TRAP transporter substrate-binding protein [Anaeromyxobacter sp.]|nr:TRAP transporter substrate-binding protein [Anaeromyxobacter sp.]
MRHPVLALAARCLAAAAVLASADAAPAAEPIVLKFSHVVAVDTPKGQAAEFFKRRAEELTRGRVRVEVYPNSTLYKDREEIEALQLGAVQMLAPSLSKFGPLGVREFEAFDLPFLFADQAALRRVTQGPVGRAILDKLEAKGIVGLSYWDNGFKCFSARRPLRTPADFRGLRMRIQSSVVLDAQMRALGALPQMMAFSDVYPALRAGVVDGTENPISNLWTQRMHEVQPHLTLTNHGYLGYAIIVNKRFWDGLPGDVRDALARAMAEATEYANRIAKEKNDADLARVRAAGTTEVHVPSPAERAALEKALAPVHAQMADRIGRGVLAAIYRATGYAPERP